MAIGFSLVLVLAFGVYVLARSIAHPILAIQKAAQQVSSGSLDAEAPVLTRDEVGDLALSFNRMTVTVRGLYEEIRRKEEHFRTLIESSLDMVIVLNADGSISFSSPSVHRSLGYSPAELLAMPPFALIHPEDVARCRADMARIGEEAGSLLQGVSLRMVRRDGISRVLEASVRNLLSHPAVRGFVVNARDVTERRQLEEKLLQAQKMEAVGRPAVAWPMISTTCLPSFLDTPTRCSPLTGWRRRPSNTPRRSGRPPPARQSSPSSFLPTAESRSCSRAPSISTRCSVECMAC